MKIKHYLSLACIMLICHTIPKYTFGQEKNASFELSDSKKFVELKTKYDKSRTRKVQEYMTESLSETRFKFTNTQLDADLALNGGINFFIKLNPGELVLKFDKRKNNTDDCIKFKKMCEGLKKVALPD